MYIDINGMERTAIGIAEHWDERNSFENKLPEILAYAANLEDQPVLDSIFAIKDNFGLTSREMEIVIHRWIAA